MSAYLKIVSDCFIDKGLLKCLLLNDNVSNVYLMTLLIYVMLLVVAIFIESVFWSHCLISATEIIEKLESWINLRKCNVKVIIQQRFASRLY